MANFRLFTGEHQESCSKEATPSDTQTARLLGTPSQTQPCRFRAVSPDVAKDCFLLDFVAQLSACMGHQINIASAQSPIVILMWPRDRPPCSATNPLLCLEDTSK